MSKKLDPYYQRKSLADSQKIAFWALIAIMAIITVVTLDHLRIITLPKWWWAR